MLVGQNEAISRILIDKALEFSGWNLLNPNQVHFELQLASGRADYLLRDKLGRVLCVLSQARGPGPLRRQGTGAWLRREPESSVRHPLQRPRTLVLELRAG